MERIRVLLADDEQLVRTGVRMVLQGAEDIDVVAETDDGESAVELACRLPMDVALIDIRMPGTDGLAAVEQLTRRAPGVKVVMLTTFGEQDYITRALRAGAAGFILKDTGPQELIQAVRVVAGGDAILSPRVTRDFISRHVSADLGRTAEARRLVGTLTDRERDVLVQLGLGASNAEAGRRLFLGEGTIKSHVSRILAKLGCVNRVQAAIMAHDADVLPGS